MEIRVFYIRFPAHNLPLAGPRRILPLLEVGRSYVPVMLANARALSSGADTVECVVEGKTWSQKPFPYQGKCVQTLRESYAALAPVDRSAVDRILSGTGCEPLVEKV